MITSTKNHQLSLKTLLRVHQDHKLSVDLSSSRQQLPNLLQLKRDTLSSNQFSKSNNLLSNRFNMLLRWFHSSNTFKSNSNLLDTSLLHSNKSNITSLLLQSNSMCHHSISFHPWEDLNFSKHHLSSSLTTSVSHQLDTKLINGPHSPNARHL